MRKYTIDVYNIVRRRKNVRLYNFFITVYKERLKRRFPTYLLKQQPEIINYFIRLMYTLKLMRRYGFFEYSTAPRIYDNENRMISRYARWLRNYKLFTNFYNNLSIRVLKRIWLKASSARIVTLNHFLALLESRIDSLLIRLNWVYSKHMIRQILRKRWFLVNGLPVTYPNYILSNFDLLSVANFKKIEVFEYLDERLKKNDFFYRPPFYLEVNYKILTCLVIHKFVSRTQLKYPFLFRCESLVYISYSKR